MKVKLVLLVSMIMIVFCVINCKKESENNLRKEVMSEKESKEKAIFLDIYQAEWYIQNEIKHPKENALESINNEKDIAYQFFSKKYNISLDEIKRIKKLDYINDAFIRCKMMQQELGSVVKNY
ncbi:MAG TPA: hypothetical protein PK771_07120 [Spirochaetota bacterium]|nr:hypothetical protein [Spirochaetota bacterium]